MKMLIRAVVPIAAIAISGIAAAESSRPAPSADKLKHYECMIRNAQRIANVPDPQGAWHGMLAALCSAKPDYKG